MVYKVGHRITQIWSKVGDRHAPCVWLRLFGLDIVGYKGSIEGPCDTCVLASRSCTRRLLLVRTYCNASVVPFHCKDTSTGSIECWSVRRATPFDDSTTCIAISKTIANNVRLSIAACLFMEESVFRRCITPFRLLTATVPVKLALGVSVQSRIIQ